MRKLRVGNRPRIRCGALGFASLLRIDAPGGFCCIGCAGRFLVERIVLKNMSDRTIVGVGIGMRGYASPAAID